MDFFAAQDRARSSSKRLVFLFALAVLGTIAAGYAAAVVLKRANELREPSDYDRLGFRNISWWDPGLFVLVTGSTLAVIGLASLFKWSQMRRGGPAVAEMVGGRPVDPKTTDLRERQLLNVVEEMAIASGIPMPAVYILDQEKGLNAFAAGLTTSDAAVAVTRGALDKLTRDELQGVVGHEFSHILNGDMRLNVRITAIIFGILVVGFLGRGILHGIMRGRVRSGGGKNKGGGVLLVLAVGLALFIIGYVGYFFGRLIQAAVSRQREFLADASAVQFTRNPAGIGGALKKIGGYALGGTVSNKHAGELGHFFFAQSLKAGLTGLLSTHPALPARIRAIEPQWDGKLFDPPTVVDVTRESFATAGFSPGQRYTPDETLRRIHEAESNLPERDAPPRIPFEPSRAVADIGRVTESHFRQAQSLLDSIPTRLREATHDASTAQTLVYGLLLHGDRAARDAQQALVAQHAGTEAATQLGALRPALGILSPAARLPLLQLTFPALRSLQAEARDRFAHTLDELMHADNLVTPFEFALQKMLLSQLQLAHRPSQPVQYDSFQALRQPVGVVLSIFARQSARDTAAAFAAGAAQIPLLADQLVLLDASASGLEQFDEALDKLSLSALPIKQRLLVAVAHVINHDGSISLEEGELYRALAATLQLPMPHLEPPPLA